ncbi:MAG: flippase-like domain-containing protein [Deltaproteobacteria bacterium]|nr:flippase-like domain-containing protein [Deltaproteobacteria bacterium]
MAGRSRARRVFHAIAIVIGAVAFAFLIDQLGWDALIAAMIGTGWWFVVMAALDLGSVMFDAGATYSFVRPYAPNVSYWRVFAAQASGVAINRLTPTNSMGEAIKITMLAEHAPTSAAVSAIVMFNLATFTVAIAAIVLGVPVTLLLLDLPGRTQTIVWIATVILIGVFVSLLVVARRGAIGTLIGAAQRIHLVSVARADRWRIKVADIDHHVKQFGRPGARRGIAFVLASRTLSWIGTIVVMIAALVPLTSPLVVANLSLGILITFLSNIVPLGLGIADGTNYALYGVLGSTGPIGLVYTMIGRARTCVLAAMGLVVLAITTLVDRRAR